MRLPITAGSRIRGVARLVGDGDCEVRGEMAISFSVREEREGKLSIAISFCICRELEETRRGEDAGADLEMMSRNNHLLRDEDRIWVCCGFRNFQSFCSSSCLHLLAFFPCQSQTTKYHFFHVKVKRQNVPRDKMPAIPEQQFRTTDLFT